MHSSRPPRGGSSLAALPALLRASHLFGLALGSALGRLQESGVTAARLFERAEESALLLRMMREAAGILGARWDKVPERHRPHYAPEQRFRLGGNDLIARTLARAGWKVSARTVGRIRRERRPARRGPEAASTVPRAVRAKRPNHVWMVDLTDVKGLFGIVTFKVAVVFDAFSRMPLSARVFSKEASAAEIARFVSRTAKQHGRPSHFVSDQARCFKGQVFRRKLRRLEVKQRFGEGSIALIERLWRTLKDTLGLRLLRPIAAEDLLDKIEMGLLHYAHFRPHQALREATPAEVYFGRTPAHLSAIPPPRGRPGEGPMDSPFHIEYLDAERMLPVLVRKAA